MAYDEDLASRVRECLAGEPVGAITEQPMFGGLAFLVNGNMAVAVSHRGGLLVRLAPAEAEKALTKPHTEQMVLAGRPSRGWVFVPAEGLRTSRQLVPWVERGAAYARNLPPKKPKRRRPATLS
jgi:TfoX/Sxy family transcriptional regulator of competence genes